MEIAFVPNVRWASDSPIGMTIEHPFSGLSTPLLDSSIDTRLTFIDFCMQDSVPRSIPNEGLSYQGLNLSIGINCAPFSRVSRHLRPIPLSFEVL